MNYFNTKQGVLFYNYTIEVEQTAKIDKFLELLDKSGVASVLKNEETEPSYGNGIVQRGPEKGLIPSSFIAEKVTKAT